jgi:hypothetical protein
MESRTNDAAYDRRFSFDHGETEYLLGTASRWMPPGDSDIPDTEAVLEAMLQKQKADPSEFKSRLRRCQAECWGNLYSHIHSVIDKREDGDRVLYLVRWKTRPGSADGRSLAQVSHRFLWHAIGLGIFQIMSGSLNRVWEPVYWVPIVIPCLKVSPGCI